MNLSAGFRLALHRLGKIVGFTAFILVATILTQTFASVTGPATAAFSFLIIVLLSAYFGDLLVAVVTSVVATLCFDYFYLPPFGTLKVSEFADWISLFAFLSASFIISSLTASAAENLAHAAKLKKAVAQLKEFGEWLLATPPDQTTLSGIAAEALRIFSLDYCSIHVQDDSQWEHFTGSAESDASKEMMDRVKLTLDHTTEWVDLADESFREVQYLQISRGTTPLALLAIKGDDISTEVMETMAAMIGIRINKPGKKVEPPAPRHSRDGPPVRFR